MKLKKIIASVAAAAVAVSAMAVNVFAADEYTAKLGFTDSGWTYQDWESSTTVTGDGQYSIESTTAAGAPDMLVFVVDIEGMYAANPDATAVLDKVEIDGAELEFDASKINYGDIEEKGNFRIEIYNDYGDTKNDPPINNVTPITTSVKVTFTVSGLGGASEPAADESVAGGDAAETSDAPAADDETASGKTGNVPAMAMVAVMAVAGTAAVVSKKRK